MPSLISDVTGFPTTYDTDISILSDSASIVDAFKNYHYGSAYDGTGTPAGIEGHLQDIYDYIATVIGTNIDTLGIITTGTWNADVIAGEYGGTGVANTGKTITLGANFATAGAYNLTLTLTTATNVTLPASGTLVNSQVTSLLDLVEVGTINTGTWNGDVITESYGGTGFFSYTVGDILYAAATDELDVLNAGAAGLALVSNGPGTAPSWGGLNIETATTGVLQVDRGGTANSTTPTAGQILIGDDVAFNLTTLDAGDGITINNTAGHIEIVNSGVLDVNGFTGSVDATPLLAALRARTTADVTTTTLAPDDQWYGFITLGYSYRIISVETSHPARVRLYDTDAHRYTDTTRPVGTDPVGEHGVMMDMITETGNLLWTSNPAIDGYNNESTLSQNIAITVDNLDLGSADITVTLTYARTE